MTHSSVSWRTGQFRPGPAGTDRPGPLVAGPCGSPRPGSAARTRSPLWPRSEALGPDPTLARMPDRPWSPAPQSTSARMLAAVLGEQEVIVLELKPFDPHGFTCCDVTVGFPDRTWSRPPRSGGGSDRQGPWVRVGRRFFEAGLSPRPERRRVARPPRRALRPHRCSLRTARRGEVRPVKVRVVSLLV
jgi:hypothetical protein